EPVDYNDATQAALINSFKVELKVRNESPIHTVFSQVQGEKDMYFTSTATAATVPTRLVYLLDLSRSSHIETHLPYERVGTKSDNTQNASEYALHITANGTCDATHSNPCPAQGLGTTCTFEGGLYPDLYSVMYRSTSPQIMKTARNLVTDYSTRRSRSDYKCY